MASKELPECAAMRECHVALVELLALSINSIGDALFAKGLVPSDVKTKIQWSSSTMTPTDKAREILNSLSVLIKHDPKGYHKFVHVLIEEGQWTESIVEKLTSCYKSLTEVKQKQNVPKNEPTAVNEHLHLKVTLAEGSSPAKVLKSISSVEVTCSVKDQNSCEKSSTKCALFEDDDQSMEIVKDSHFQTKTNEVIPSRDVLFLVSKSVQCSMPKVQRRSKRSLARDEYRKLDSQGVHQECCHSDLSIMMARYGFDKLCSIERLESEMSFQEAICRIENLMRNTVKNGVVLHYIGPGKRETGDWCFRDGYITFADIVEIYCTHLKGRVLTIVSDCSFSGNWVKMAMNFLDKQEVGPCGHVAKEKKILIKVFASCKANEIPVERTFSIHCATNDKNSGQLLWDLEAGRICDDQHAYGIDFTKIRCKNKIDQPCTMRPGSSWKVWNYKVVLLQNEDNGRHAWHYAMTNDDETNMPVHVLFNGWGQGPPAHIKQQITDRYFVNYDYSNCSEEVSDNEMSL